jgi:hypothetical protein
MGVYPFHQAQGVVNRPPTALPTALRLYPACPNPFNAVTMLRFDLIKSGPVTLTLYDIAGRQTCRVVDAYFNPGSYQYPLDASQFASGLYLLKLQAGGIAVIQKVVVMK